MSQDKSFLKDKLFNSSKITQLANEIQRVYGDFQKENFVKEIMIALPTLELKQRISHITKCLYNFLPQNYPRAIEIILSALPPILDPHKEDNDFWDFIYAPYAEFVADYGCTNDFLETSFHALQEITMRFSAEFAIREFYCQFPKETFQQMKLRALDKNYHVRRLASEWSRPHLPRWKKIPLLPHQWLELLELLRKDTTSYVIRSVANHCNDISKQYPQLIIDTISRWKNANYHDKKTMNYLIRHALRTMIKQWNTDALQYIGYSKPMIKNHTLTVHTPQVSLWSYLIFSFEVQSERNQMMYFTYNIQYKRISNKNRSKIFMLWKNTYKKNEKITFTKKHIIKTMTTRHIYPWEHYISILSYGSVLAQQSFIVV